MFYYLSNTGGLTKFDAKMHLQISEQFKKQISNMRNDIDALDERKRNLLEQINKLEGDLVLMDSYKGDTN